MHPHFRELIKVAQRNFRKFMSMREWGWFIIIQKTRPLIGRWVKICQNSSIFVHILHFAQTRPERGAQAFGGKSCGHLRCVQGEVRHQGQPSFVSIILELGLPCVASLFNLAKAEKAK